MVELSVDRENKKFHVEVELVGEETPISCDVRYELTVAEGMNGAHFKAQSISISKEWLDLVAQEVVNREFIIQGKNATRIIKLVKNVGLI